VEHHNHAAGSTGDTGDTGDTGLEHMSTEHRQALTRMMCASALEQAALRGEGVSCCLVAEDCNSAQCGGECTCGARVARQCDCGKSVFSGPQCENGLPTPWPTPAPSRPPTHRPTPRPTDVPTKAPTASPVGPSFSPTPVPTQQPTVSPTGSQLSPRVRDFMRQARRESAADGFVAPPTRRHHGRAGKNCRTFKSQAPDPPPPPTSLFFPAKGAKCRTNAAVPSRHRPFH
jgi:hypothetical protein